MSQSDRIGILSACPEAFNGPWTVRHQVITRLAKDFWTVWFEPATYWRKLHGRLSFPKTVPVPDHGRLLRYDPGLSPKLNHSRQLGRLLDRMRLRQAARQLRNRGCDRIILYLWRPEYAHFRDLLKADQCLYHIDDEYSFSEQESEIPQRELHLIQAADNVIIHSPALMEKKGNINPSTTFVPNGVDYAWYAAPHDQPEDLKRIPYPRAGYIGIIKTQLDLAILKHLAEDRSDVSFVLVGPRGTLKSDVGILNELSRLPNVFELGPKEPQELAAYMQHMNVLLMCYKKNDYTKFIYPLKMHEYLATGRPVISTPLRSVRDFDEVVMLAETSHEWATALSDALSAASLSDAQVRRRQAVARTHDWNTLVERIRGLIRTRW